MKKLIMTLLPALSLMPLGIASLNAANAPDRSAGVLATQGQYDREVIMLRVLASQSMRRAVARLEARYRADPQGATKAGAATIRRAVDSIALAAVSYIVGGNPARPVALWTTHAPHRWAGMAVPGSGYGIDNPDNVYRNFAVAGGSRYLIRGRITRPGPIEQHFTLMDSIPGTTPLTAEGGTMLATLRSDQMEIAPDGSFTITIDSDAAEGRRNHLKMPPAGNFLLIVRDLFTDWNQVPIMLEVERVSGPESPPLSEAEMADRAAALLDQIGPYWVDYDNRFVYSRPVNQVSTPRQRPGGRGFSTAGHFSLSLNDALVVTIDPLGAASLGFQLTDPWGVAYEYRNRTSSLNNTQARPNSDGTLTFVIAQRDPGVHNWLDPQGFGSGIFAIRWQGLPVGAEPGPSVRSVKRVPIAGLRQALPEGTVFVTKAQRKAQRVQRAREYARRLCGALRPDACARWKPHQESERERGAQTPKSALGAGT